MRLGLVAAFVAMFASPGPAIAWGDEGHEVIGLIADHYLEARVRDRVHAMLLRDTTGLTVTDIAHESTWADKFRDSDRDSDAVHYLQTRNWHFVDLEIDGADVKGACFGQPTLASGVRASAGPAEDCVIDKIDQFAVELKNPHTDPEEALAALQFLLHLVGDLHQPLHASDDHDQGGNKKRVSGASIPSNNLHHDWDVEFVARLGRDENEIAGRLIATLSPASVRQWSSGSPTDWGLETFAIGKSHAYGLLPAPTGRNHYELSDAYLVDATQVTAEQLAKAGVRLAFILNQALR
jgi:hypothetical protein